MRARCRSIMRWLEKPTARICIAVAASGAAIGIVLAVGVAEGNNHGTNHRVVGKAASRPVGHVATATVPASLAASYSFLSSPSSTAMPASLDSNVDFAATQYGAESSLAREAGVVGSHQMWLVPGNSGSCIELDSGYAACGSNSVVESQGVWVMLQPVTGAAPTLYGIVPDGATVSAAAGSATVSQSGNAVSAQASSAAMGHIIIQTAAGATIDLTVPPATGQPQQS